MSNTNKHYTMKEYAEMIGGRAVRFFEYSQDLANKKIDPYSLATDKISKDTNVKRANTVFDITD